MKFIQFTNEGQLDPRAISLLGASTKRGDDATIGMFGSGFTYSIAYLLRNNIDFYIFSGEKEIRVSTKKEDFREKSFEVIYVDGEKTSITTDTGPTWQIQDVVRELYCNALDEPEFSFETNVLSPSGQKGYTNIFIEQTNNVGNMLKDWKEYFCENLMVLDETLYGQILLPNTIPKLYYKGIWCSEILGNHKYSYNSPHFEINESRKADSWKAVSVISRILGSISDVRLIKQIIQTGHYEQYQMYLRTAPLSPSWEEELRKYDGKIVTSGIKALLSSEESIGCICLEENFAAMICRRFKIEMFGKDVRGRNYKPGGITTEQLIRINHILSSLTATGYNIPFEIQGGQFSDNRIIALADCSQQKIILNSQCIDQQTDIELASTLLEEYFHIRENLYDETREFQTFLLDELAAKCLA